MRILYVEDDASVVQTVQLMLETEGHSCDATDSGKRAVELAKSGSYDIILLDIMLPDIDGYEVIKRLRASGVRTPILIQTGLVGDGIRHDGLSLGVSQYLVKPFNKAELIERIEGIVSGAGRKPWPEPSVQPAAEDSLQDHSDERRQHRRFGTTLPAKILHNDGIDCMILNMSYGGAAIQLPRADTNCPAVFDLQIAFGTKFRCKVCWRFQDKIGVKGEADWSEQIMAARSRAAAPAAASADAAPPTAADREDLPLSYAPRAPAAEPRAQAPASTGRDQDTPLPDIQGLAEEPAAATALDPSSQVLAVSPVVSPTMSPAPNFLPSACATFARRTNVSSARIVYLDMGDLSWASSSRGRPSLCRVTGMPAAVGRAHGCHVVGEPAGSLEPEALQAVGSHAPSAQLI